MIHEEDRKQLDRALGHRPPQKICPLLSKIFGSFMDCQEERCMWYCEIEKACAIWVLSRE